MKQLLNTLSGLQLKENRVFDSSGRESELRVKSIQGGVWTAFGQGGKALLQFGGTIVLARLLTPDDFGLIGMIAAVVGLVQAIKDAGLSSATIQAEKISEQQVSALFWINVVFSGLLAVILLGMAPLVAVFYKRQELTAITAVLAISFLVSGLSIQHEALLKRHMYFKSLALIQVVAQVTYVIISVTAAYSGQGYWALVMGALASAASSAILTVFCCKWRPSRFRRGGGAGHLIRFGVDVLGFNIANYFSRNADYLLIGKFLGAEALGFYSRAYQLFMQPLTQLRTPLANVALPALSALSSKPKEYSSYFRRFLRILATAAVPLSVYSVIDAEFIVVALLGPQWQAAAPVFRLLAFAGVLQSVSTTRGLVLLSCGRSRKYLMLGIIDAAVMVTSFAIGLSWGIEGIAAAYAIANVAIFIPSIWYFTRSTPVGLFDYMRALFSPACWSVIAGLVSWGVSAVWGGSGASGHILRLIVFYGSYLGLVSLSRSCRADLAVILKAFGVSHGQ